MTQYTNDYKYKLNRSISLKLTLSANGSNRGVSPEVLEVDYGSPEFLVKGGLRVINKNLHKKGN